MNKNVQACWEKVSLPICIFRAFLEGNVKLGGTAATLWPLGNMHEDETLLTVVDKTPF